MSCTFCGIAAGDVPAYEVWRDDAHVAFLDIRPLFVGHVLVVPTHHTTTLADLGPAAIGPFFSVVHRIESAVREACDAPGSFVACNNVVSQSVPHLHVHVVPRRPKDGLRGFFWPRTRYDDDAHAVRTAAAIAARLH